MPGERLALAVVGLLEKSADDDLKLAQQVGKLQLFIGAQDSWWLLRTYDQCCLRVGIENHHERHWLRTFDRDK